MLLKEACARSGLTKKAVHYYESRGLLAPGVQSNGYRYYSEEDVARLREIATLRRLGIGVEQIGSILKSANKGAALEKYRYLSQLKIERLQTVQDCLSALARDYDVERIFDRLQCVEMDEYTLRERMALAFPGNYGLFLSLHFGRFLNEPVDTPEKRAAFRAVIGYLDEVELYLPPELEEGLRQALEAQDATALQARNQAAMEDVLEDPQRYLEAQEEQIRQYLEFKRSEAYRNSPAGMLEQMLLDFQRRSGYQEVLLENLKVLSCAYRDYMERLQRANAAFYKRFPEAQSLYQK